jgi:DNA-binding GntR family transcriptional regulator
VREPLYIQVGDDLERRIMAGEWTGRLPTVRALAEEYGCSHTTLEYALAYLRGRGLTLALSRRRTTVTRPGSA